jgi:hypothetical protein
VNFSGTIRRASGTMGLSPDAEISPRLSMFGMTLI